MSTVGRIARQVRSHSRIHVRLERARNELTLIAQAARTDLEPGQKLTLDLGAAIVLAMLGLGIELGHWGAWSAPLGMTGYVFWVVAYSEASARAARRRTAAAG